MSVGHCRTERMMKPERPAPGTLIPPGTSQRTVSADSDQGQRVALPSSSEGSGGCRQRRLGTVLRRDPAGSSWQAHLHMIGRRQRSRRLPPTRVERRLIWLSRVPRLQSQVVPVPSWNQCDPCLS